MKLFALSDGNGDDVMKQSIETNVDVNAVNFTSAHFSLVALGTSNGLEIRNVKKGELLFKNDKIAASPCLALAYDASKKYLFAGHADGTIRVYAITNQE